MWTPVLEGLCTYLDIKENRVDLCDLDRMNELILVRRINQHRASAWAQRRDERMGKPADLPLVGNLGDGFDPTPRSGGFDALPRSAAIDARWRR